MDEDSMKKHVFMTFFLLLEHHKSRSTNNVINAGQYPLGIVAAKTYTYANHVEDIMIAHLPLWLSQSKLLNCIIQ